MLLHRTTAGETMGPAALSQLIFIHLLILSAAPEYIFSWVADRRPPACPWVFKTLGGLWRPFVLLGLKDWTKAMSQKAYLKMIAGKLVGFNICVCLAGPNIQIGEKIATSNSSWNLLFVNLLFGSNFTGLLQATRKPSAVRQHVQQRHIEMEKMEERSTSQIQSVWNIMFAARNAAALCLPYHIFWTPLGLQAASHTSFVIERLPQRTRKPRFTAHWQNCFVCVKLVWFVVRIAI